MNRYPVLKAREVIKILNKLGFFEARQRSSHLQFRHSDKRCTTVPIHAGKDISPILLRQITKDINITIDNLLDQK